MLKKRKKVLCAMSGGVDSSVAALLLQRQGYQVIGVTMQLVGEEMARLGGFEAFDSGCCSLSDVEDAKAVCAKLGIEHYTLNFEADFRHYVVDDFVSEYRQGHTPNPCIRCNRFLKFEKLMARALTLGCDYLATGHYAQVLRVGPDSGREAIGQNFNLRLGQDSLQTHQLDGAPGKAFADACDLAEFPYLLGIAVDQDKDQSYVLYTLSQRQLAHLLLPLGRFHKSEVRQIAAQAGLVTAHKAESQDICFIPDGDYAGFLRRYAKVEDKAGEIVDEQGQVLGQHQGLQHFTIGQRKGLGLGGGVSGGKPLYVKALLPQANQVVVTHRDHLCQDELEATDLQGPLWSATARSALIDLSQINLTVKYRYRQHPVPVEALEVGPTSLRARFSEGQYGISPGQSVVFYAGDYVLGGGIVTSAAFSRMLACV